MPEPPRISRVAGTRHAYSTTRASSSGTRVSRLTAMAARPSFTRISSGAGEVGGQTEEHRPAAIPFPSSLSGENPTEPSTATSTTHSLPHQLELIVNFTKGKGH